MVLSSALLETPLTITSRQQTQKLPQSQVITTRHLIKPIAGAYNRSDHALVVHA